MADVRVCESADDGEHIWGPESEEVTHTFGGAIREDTTECVSCGAPRKYVLEADRG